MHACVFLWAWQVRDTGALLSPTHGTGEFQPRGEHDCWRSTLLGETAAKAVSSALLGIIWPPRNTNNHEVLFLNLLFFFCAHHEGTNQAPKTTAVSTYRKHSRTASNRPCTEQQSTFSSMFVSTRVRQGKQAGMKEHVKCCREPCTSEYFMFFSSLLFLLVYTKKANNN